MTLDVCQYCRGVIEENSYGIISNKKWHESCLNCCDCNSPLKDKCYYKLNKLYCRKDYFRRFAPKCNGCKQTLLAEDKIRKAKNNFYHLPCYKCQECSQKFLTGDVLHLVDEMFLFCNKDYYRLYGSDNLTEMSNETKLELKDSDDYDTEKIIDSDNIVSKISKTDGKFWENQKCEDSFSTDTQYEKSVLSSLATDSEECTTLTSNSVATKRRGPRTTIKAKQLEMLKIAFASTPKPTRHIREKLADETGLSMRVIQVWFQNRRSKERRIKQMNTYNNRRHLFGRIPADRYKVLQNHNLNHFLPSQQNGHVYSDNVLLPDQKINISNVDEYTDRLPASDYYRLFDDNTSISHAHKSFNTQLDSEKTINVNERCQNLNFLPNTKDIGKQFDMFSEDFTKSKSNSQQSSASMLMQSVSNHNREGGSNLMEQHGNVPYQYQEKFENSQMFVHNITQWE